MRLSCSAICHRAVSRSGVLPGRFSRCVFWQSPETKDKNSKGGPMLWHVGCRIRECRENTYCFCRLRGVYLLFSSVVDQCMLTRIASFCNFTRAFIFAFFFEINRIRYKQEVSTPTCKPHRCAAQKYPVIQGEPLDSYFSPLFLPSFSLLIVIILNV